MVPDTIKSEEAPKKRGRPRKEEAKKAEPEEKVEVEEKYGGGVIECKRCGYEKEFRNVPYLPATICTGCGMPMRVRVDYKRGI